MHMSGKMFYVAINIITEQYRKAEGLQKFVTFCIFAKENDKLLHHVRCISMLISNINTYTYIAQIVLCLYNTGNYVLWLGL